LAGAFTNADIWIPEATSKVTLTKTNTLQGSVLIRGGGNCCVQQVDGLLSASAVYLGNTSSIGRLYVSNTESVPLKLKSLVVGRTNSYIHIV
jgi:hypothetical protein